MTTTITTTAIVRAVERIVPGEFVVELDVDADNARAYGRLVGQRIEAVVEVKP